MIINFNIIKRLWGYLRPYWHLELITFIVMAVMATLMLAMPIAVQYLIDDLIPSLIAGASDGVNIGPVVYFGLILLGIYLLNILFAYLRDYIVAYIGANIIANMRTKLFAHLESLSMDFHQSHQVGDRTNSPALHRKLHIVFIGFDHPVAFPGFRREGFN